MPQRRGCGRAARPGTTSWRTCVTCTGRWGAPRHLANQMPPIAGYRGGVSNGPVGRHLSAVVPLMSAMARASLFQFLESTLRGQAASKLTQHPAEGERAIRKHVHPIPFNNTARRARYSNSTIAASHSPAALQKVRVHLILSDTLGLALRPFVLRTVDTVRPAGHRPRNTEPQPQASRGGYRARSSRRILHPDSLGPTRPQRQSAASR